MLKSAKKDILGKETFNEGTPGKYTKRERPPALPCSSFLLPSPSTNRYWTAAYSKPGSVHGRAKKRSGWFFRARKSKSADRSKVDPANPAHRAQPGIRA